MPVFGVFEEAVGGIRFFMRLKVALVVTVLLALACEGMVPTETVKTEPGTVVGVGYVPSQSSTGIGMSFSGHLVVTSSSTDPVYGVTFHCQHGNFGVNNEKAFKSLQPGENVTITYREKKYNDGSEVYEFIKAEPEP